MSYDVVLKNNKPTHGVSLGITRPSCKTVSPTGLERRVIGAVVGNKEEQEGETWEVTGSRINKAYT